MASLIEQEHAILMIGRESLPEEARKVLDGEPLSATELYRYQAWLCEQCDGAYDACTCDVCTTEPRIEECPLGRVSLEADARRDAAREAWLQSDDEREWRFGGDSLGGGSEAGHWHAPSDVLAELTDWSSEGWDRARTIWVNNWCRQVDPVTGDLVGDGHTVSVTIDPDPPECAEGKEHAWCSPCAVVGGIAENPGVWGHGGGVIVREVCRHCGAYCVTDTWATCPDGTVGTSVTYEPADEDSRAWIQSRAVKS